MPETLFQFETADDAIGVLESDLECAREEAAFRMEVNAKECDLVEASEVLNFDDFLGEYTLSEPSLGSNQSVDLATDWLSAEEVRGYPAEQVWTVLDCDGVLWLASGFHFVNRVGYLVTEEEHGFAMTDYAVA